MSITFGILNPGAMGTAVAACAKSSGCRVIWASEERSEATRGRSVEQGFEDVATVATMCAQADIIACVCPPHAAEDVARQVAAYGYQGLYLDANAISPDRAKREAALIVQAGGSFCDGGIVGGPPWQPGTTLYLSGERGDEIAACFAGTPLDAQIIGDEPGKASAMKMCYAAGTKGGTALLVTLVAAAQELGVWPELQARWDYQTEGRAASEAQRIRGVTAKAWRFVGEMDEIADTLASAGLPADFFVGAAELYRRLAEFKEAPELPPLDDVLGSARSSAPAKD